MDISSFHFVTVHFKLDQYFTRYHFLSQCSVCTCTCDRNITNVIMYQVVLKRPRRCLISNKRWISVCILITDLQVWWVVVCFAPTVWPWRPFAPSFPGTPASPCSPSLPCWTKRQKNTQRDEEIKFTVFYPSPWTLRDNTICISASN